MKKILRGIGLLIIMVVALLILTGCGEDTIVATMEGNEGITSNYKEEIIVKLKNDRITKVLANIEFEKEDDAKEMYKAYKSIALMDDKDEQYELKISGKKITMEIPVDEFEEKENMSKEEIKSMLENEGYKVK